MSASSKPALIGAFIIGAVLLIFSAIAVFSSVTFFSPKAEVVILFEESVQGLRVGATVSFRGVPIGQVKAITLAQADGKAFIAPVYITFTGNADSDKNFLQRAGSDDLQEALNPLFARGFRARLVPQSFITGQLMIELDFFSGADLPSEITSLPNYNDVAQIPAIPSRLESFWKRFDNIPIQHIAENINSSAEQLLILLEDINQSQIVPEIEQILYAFEQNNKALTELVAHAQDFVDTANTVATSIGSSVPKIDGKVHTFLDDAHKNMDAIEKLLEMLQYNINPANPMVSNFQESLYELRRAARAVYELTTDIERQPEILLFGKPQP